jgi:hypothetical protein
MALCSCHVSLTNDHLWIQNWAPRLFGSSVVENDLVLKAGELLSFWTCGQIIHDDHDDDGSTVHVDVMKNFFHGQTDSEFVFPPDDGSIGYYNNKVEQDRKKIDGLKQAIPNVTAKRDPAGVLHYCLVGHDEEWQGDLRIPQNVPFQLRVGAL